MEKSRVLVVGTGSIGERHARCFGQTGRAEVHICEMNRERCDAVAERCAVASAHYDLDSAMANSYDVAAICVPANLHIPVAIQLGSAGTHLLIEKPLSTGFDRIDELQEVIRAQNLTVGIAYVLRCNPVLESLKATIHSGRFGRPVQIVSTSGQHFPKYRPAYREIYYTDHRTGGGAIQDAITHVMNAGEWIVGPVERLFADAQHQVLEGVNVEDTVHILTRQGEGVLGSYSLNQYQAPNEGALQIVCERGTARFVMHENRWLSMTEAGGTWTEEMKGDFERDDFFICQANRFLDAVAGKEPVRCTLEEAMQTLRVNLAALRCLDEGAWIKIA